VNKTPLLLAPLLLACATASHAAAHAMAEKVDNAALPEAVRVPAGEMQKLWTVGAGEITYECREKTAAAGQYEWVFVAPVATLKDAGGKLVGKYYGGPTWEANDGSKVSGKQVAVAPAGAGAIPLQLVKADPAVGAGAMQGVSYIQRLKTQGGVAPSAACAMANKGARMQVAYQADYVFYGR
jgi:subtilisin family serine protease